MKAIFLFFLSFATTACLKISDVPKESVEAEAHPVDLELPTVQALSSANAYQVHLPFPPSATTAVRYDKFEISRPENLVVTMKDGHITDNFAEGGHVYIYKFGVNSQGNFQELKTYEVVIPEDLEINEHIELKEAKTWNQYKRLFLTKKGRITTNGHQLVIDVDQIHSDGGVIQTLAAGSQAGTGDGIAGGNIQIKARTGAGHLKIELRGQKGATGMKGQNHPGHPVAACAENKYYRIADGKKGNPGQVGFSGGNTGKAEVQLLDSHTFIVEPIFEMGEGGDGGPGGDGECTLPGFQVPGPPGDVGSKGSPGQKESFCVQDIDKLTCM